MDGLGGGLALVLLGVVVALALGQGLRWAWALLWSLGRAVLQLVVLAYGLAFVVSLASPWALGVGLILLLAIATKLLENRLSLDWPLGRLGLLGLMLLALAPVAYAVVVVLRPPLWYDPRLWLPLASAVLVQGVQIGAIAGNHFATALQRQRLALEARLSLGATPAQAVQEWRRASIRAALSPTQQTLAIAGLGSIPLFLGGQVFAGVDPLQAVLYELLLSLVLLSSGLLVARGLIWGIEKRAFNPLGQMKDP